jgi:hypothetical protein
VTLGPLGELIPCSHTEVRCKPGHVRGPHDVLRVARGDAILHARRNGANVDVVMVLREVDRPDRGHEEEGRDHKQRVAVRATQRELLVQDEDTTDDATQTEAEPDETDVFLSKGSPYPTHPNTRHGI